MVTHLAIGVQIVDVFATGIYVFPADLGSSVITVDDIYRTYSMNIETTTFEPVRVRGDRV